MILIKKYIIWYKKLVSWYKKIIFDMEKQGINSKTAPHKTFI